MFWYWLGPKNIFFRSKTFLFFKIESWNFQNRFEKEFRKTSQSFNSIRQHIEKNENNNCLNKMNELKFCEVSWNSFSNRFWKFQLSILKNRKILFLKKLFFKPLSISKQKSFVYWLNFPGRFWEEHWQGFAFMKLIIALLNIFQTTKVGLVKTAILCPND